MWFVLFLFGCAYGKLSPAHPDGQLNEVAVEILGVV